MKEYMIVGPTNVIPAFFRALLRASDSDVLRSNRNAHVQQQQQHFVRFAEAVPASCLHSLDSA